MTDGSDTSIEDLAVRDGVRRDEAGLIFHLAFLAPDIVEIILEGRQPREPSLKRLKRMRHLPHLWEEQRKALGIAA